MEEQKGFVVAIEGCDSVGKATQTRLLAAALKAAGYKVVVYTYPNYASPYGHEIRRYLNGEFGPATELDPRLASSLYALDRATQAKEIFRRMDEGYIVLLDRSTYSNAAIQGAKIHDDAERAEFVHWVVEREFTDLGIPKPRHVFFLAGSPQDCRELLENRTADSSVAKDGRSDQHESDLPFLMRAYSGYETIARTSPDWVSIPMIQLAPAPTIRGKGEIHKEILDHTLRFLDVE